MVFMFNYTILNNCDKSNVLVDSPSVEALCCDHIL